MGSDLDEMIDFQNVKSRDLWYFERNLSELVMYGYKHLHRGDLNESGNFEKGNLSCMVTKMLYEGDLNKNDNFNEWNQPRLVTTFYIGTILTKMAILEMGN